MRNAEKSRTRKKYESATNSIARKGSRKKFPLAGSRGDFVPSRLSLVGFGGNASTVPRATSTSKALNKGAGSEASLPVTLRVRRRAPKLFFSPRFREEPKNCLPESNFSGRQEIHSLMANIFVDRYRSPVSGRMTTMFLPANSGRAATCDAAQTAAPDVMPASTPSCAASSRPVR